MAQPTYIARKHEDADFKALTVDSLVVNTATVGAGAIVLADGETITMGTGSDVTIQWDATNALIAAAADDSLIEIGDSAATQKSFDLKWYGNTANGADYAYFDASANLIYTTGVDLQFKDNDVLAIGTGSGAAGDVSFVWDATDLHMNAAAAAATWNIGATDHWLNSVQTGTLAIASSGTPLPLTLNTQLALAVWSTQSATTASEFDAVKINSVQTGAGAIAVGLRVNLETNVKLGTWANAAYISMDLKTNGGVTGLGTAICGELVMGAAATDGTFGVFEGEISCPASWTGTGPVSFLYLNSYGDTKANFDDYGYLFSLSGVSSGSAHLWYDHQGGAPANVEEWLRVKTPAGDRWLALYNAVV